MRGGNVGPVLEELYAFDKRDLIGEGAYGLVYRARDRSAPHRLVAVKQMKMSREGVGIPHDAYREIRILQELQHENLIRLERVLLKPSKGEVALVYDYADHDLSDIIRFHRGKTPCNPRVVKSILHQVLQGLAFLHRNWVMHRDMKPANILIMGDSSPEPGHVKIADLGLARIFQSPARKLSKDGDVVTIWYRAPELLLGSQHYTRAIDMWAVGCIFAELLLAQPLFPGDEIKGTNFQSDQLRRIFAVLGKPDAAQWPDVVECPLWDKVDAWRNDEYRNRLAEKVPIGATQRSALNLLQRMLVYDPAQRITADQALKHAYFRETPLPCANVFRTSDGSLQRYPPRKLRGEAAAAAAARAAEARPAPTASSTGARA